MFKDTFVKICKRKGMSPTYVCKEIGLTSAAFSNWNENSIPRRATLVKLSNFLNVSIEELLEESSSECKKEKPPIRIHEGELLSSAKMRMVPVFDSVSAGFGAEALEDVAEYIPLYFENLEEAERTFCINVKGNSMSPKIEDGDIIQICKQDSIDSGKIGVVLIDGTDALVKQIWIGDKGITLHSFNPFYPDMVFDPSEADHVKVVGVVKKIIKTL